MSEYLDNFVPELPIWSEVETGTSGWSVKSCRYLQSTMYLYRPPGNGDFSTFPAYNESAHELTSFLLNLPQSCAGNIMLHRERMNLRTTPWSIMPNGYYYAKQESIVFIRTKPLFHLISWWNFLPIGCFDISADNLSPEVAEELIEYVCSR